MPSSAKRRPQFGCLTDKPKDLEMFFRPHEFRAEQRQRRLDRLTGVQLGLGVLLAFVLPLVLATMRLSIITDARILTVDALAFCVLIVVPAYFERQTKREKRHMMWLLMAGVIFNVASLIFL